MLIPGIKIFGPIPWEFDFKIFASILKSRRWHPYAWVFHFQNHLSYTTFYTDCFKIYIHGYLVDFVSTHAILTRVTCRFLDVFRAKLYLTHDYPQQDWYQKMWNLIAHLLIYAKSLSHDVHLPKHPRKSSKFDF